MLDEGSRRRRREAALYLKPKRERETNAADECNTRFFNLLGALPPRHPRALWGLLSVNTQLIAIDKKGMAMSTEAAIQLHKFTVQKLVRGGWALESSRP